MDMVEKLGFEWDRNAVSAGSSTSVERAAFRYKQSLTEFVYDASALEKTRSPTQRARRSWMV